MTFTGNGRGQRRQQESHGGLPPQRGPDRPDQASDAPDRMSAGAPASVARPLVSTVILAYLLGVAAVVGLVLAAGAWDVAANTRLLAGLMAAGVIPLGEDDPGFGSGVPAVDLFIRSQEPVVWQLVLLAVALFLMVAVLKGLQFHRISSLVGIDGTLGQHLRAYVYGNGVGRLTPYRMGEVAWASALQGQGSTLSQGARVVYLLKGFLLFEVASFALVGLFLNGVFTWAVSLAPPLLILGLCYLFVRPSRGERRGHKGEASFRTAVAELAREPRMLGELVLLSLVSFFLVEVASYVVPMAFSTVSVPLIQDELRIIVVDAPLVIMAVVGGYIARLVPVTPGGIGQFEWAFALVLTVGGLPFASAAVLALLVSAVRYTSGGLLFLGILLTYGVETRLRDVLKTFRRPAAPLSRTEVPA